MVMMIDSGSDANVITEDLWNEIHELFSKDRIFLYDVNLAAKMKISAFASHRPLQIVASFRAWITIENATKGSRRFVEFLAIRNRCIAARSQH